MGHIIGGGFLLATTKEAAMREGLADAKEFVARNADRHENPSGIYSNSFRFYDRVFNTEEDAEEFFINLGSYCDGVCIVKQATKSAQAKLAKAREKIIQKKRQMRAAAVEAFKERKSASVGCKKCGTRIQAEVALNKKLICPNCYNWLVSDSYKQRYAKLDESLKLAEEQYKKDCAETGKPRYWAKYEVHC